jgi:hypothetical protein
LTRLVWLGARKNLELGPANLDDAKKNSEHAEELRKLATDLGREVRLTQARHERGVCDAAVSEAGSP